MRATLARILRRIAWKLHPELLNIRSITYTPSAIDDQAVAARVVAIIKAGGRK